MSYLADGGDKHSKYKHNRLQDKPYALRLIQLLPASDTGQELCCELISSNLEELPSYKALSYVWGDPKCTRNILIEGQPYPVTNNCYAAMACLRHQTNQTTLWIDAICINQGDVEEKNQQLGMMVDIYAKAEETLIWMGLNNALCKDASFIEILRCFEKLVVDTMIDLTSSSDVKVSQARYDAILVQPAKSNLLLVWGALIELFRHAWWTRLWVHQELASSHKPTVVVGLYRFSWDLFLPFLRVMSAKEWMSSGAEFLATPNLQLAANGYAHLLDAIGYQSLMPRYLARDKEHLRLKIVEQRNLESTLGEISMDDPEILEFDSSGTMELLYWTKGYHCTDPRDHVFALRGLLTDGKLLAEADYTLSTKHVYARFARRFIDLYGSLNILRLGGIEWRDYTSLEDSDSAWPSWIPYLGTVDGLASSSDESSPMWNIENGRYFAAAKGLGRAGKAQIIGDDEQLEICGYFVDALEVLQLPFADVRGVTFEDFTRSVWRELAPNLPPAYPTGCDPKHALFRILTNNTRPASKDYWNSCYEYISDSIAWIEQGGLPDKGRVPDTSFDSQLAPMDLCSSDSAPHVPEKSTSHWSTTIALDLKSSILGSTARRTFLRTRRGFIGLAPQLAEVGDEIWILPGCSVPMVLRKCDGGYTLVGECFVHGIMEGEQTEDLLASGLPRIITLH